ncbi:hypothetical protein TWF506_004665 [Arthrobotrys conoides]|uniref:Uncharacterized protein n=1 Tax=Arthrobotrys conoides TaxID=74498 RepID=A0AAN8NF58_9PEZI
MDFSERPYHQDYPYTARAIGMSVDNCHSKGIPIGLSSPPNIPIPGLYNSWILAGCSSSNEFYPVETCRPAPQSSQYVDSTMEGLEKVPCPAPGCGTNGTHEVIPNTDYFMLHSPHDTACTGTAAPFKDLNSFEFGALPENYYRCLFEDTGIPKEAGKTQKLVPQRLTDLAKYQEFDLDTRDPGYFSYHSQDSYVEGHTQHSPDDTSKMSCEPLEATMDTYDVYDDVNELEEPTLGLNVGQDQESVPLFSSSTMYKSHYDGPVSLVQESRPSKYQVKRIAEEVWNFRGGWMEKATLTFISMYAPSTIWPITHLIIDDTSPTPY